MSLHFPLHTHSNTHTLSGSFLQKSAHWTNPLALAAGRERNRGEPRFQDRNFPLFFTLICPNISPSLSVAWGWKRKRGDARWKCGEMGKRGEKCQNVLPVMLFSIHQLLHMYKETWRQEKMENQARWTRESRWRGHVKPFSFTYSWNSLYMLFGRLRIKCEWISGFHVCLLPIFLLCMASGPNH